MLVNLQVLSSHALLSLHCLSTKISKTIKRRGRKYELEQSINYWYDLNSNYEVFFGEYSWSKLLVIDVDNLDFVNNPDDKTHIINLIENNVGVPQPV